MYIWNSNVSNVCEFEQNLSGAMFIDTHIFSLWQERKSIILRWELTLCARYLFDQPQCDNSSKGQVFID